MNKFKKWSPQTKSFVVLMCVAVFGAYLVLMVSQSAVMNGPVAYVEMGFHTPAKAAPTVAGASFMPQYKNVDTSSWKTYNDQTYPLSFRYAPDWAVSAPKQADSDGFYVLQIDPGSKYYNMKIYISGSQFYGLGGLPYTTMTINGTPAENFSNLLYGMKNGQYYYTFDNGLSTAMIDNFNALVQTVSFK